MKANDVQRRDFIKQTGIYTAGLLLGGSGSMPPTKENRNKGKSLEAIREAVYLTPMVDAHEHLYPESFRLSGERMIGRQCNDWTILLNHYLNSDMIVAGMSNEDYRMFFSPDTDPVDKWKYLEPIWQETKFTGYAQAVRLTLKELYDIEDISASSVPRLQEAYERLLVKGFYKNVLQGSKANIESCQVDPLIDYPVLRSEYPEFIMSDLKANSFVSDPGNAKLANEAGIIPATLQDWHQVIDYWFDRYGKYVVGIKVSLAYGRRIDFQPTEAEKVSDTCHQILQGQPVDGEDRKALEDHLFWYVVNKATEFNLPVKIHLGYLAGQDRMDLANVRTNPGDATMLCRQGPHARFVFFHISYPYYEEMLAVAKHYSNAYIDMCWSWIINPVSAQEFLKKFIVTVPSNKLIVFGGDYRVAESTVGHAIITRDGIARALDDLVTEKYITEKEALGLIDPLLRDNCHKIFSLAEKSTLLKGLDWSKL
ncbi:MAG: amidohydrolase family protein [Saprospiraceae bacterium]|nr:amidohydrolase family protein [Saprospiraceae bacterium]